MTAPRPGRYTALLFDLDGTLVHSLPDMAGALNAMLADLDLPELAYDEVRLMIGDGIPALVSRALAASSAEAEDVVPHGPDGTPDREAINLHFRRHYRARLTRETRPYPGVVETLEGLRDAGWRMAVCTNKAAEPARRIVEELELSHFFEGLAGGDSYAQPKPAADPLLGLADHLGHPVEQVVMIGDSPADIGAARNAGTPAVAVSYGYRKVSAEELGADALIDRFEDLPAALAGLMAKA